MQNILNTYKVSQEKQYILFINWICQKSESQRIPKKKNIIRKKNLCLDNHCSVSDYESAEVC